MVLTTAQLEALKLLANAADGYTVPFMLSHGCGVAALRRLMRCGLAVTDRVRVPGKRGSPVIARLRISDAGRRALAAIEEAEQMSWRDTMITVAISVLLAAAITVSVRIVMENLAF
jgi:hypothetical protein